MIFFFFFICEAGQMVLNYNVRVVLWCVRLWSGQLKKEGFNTHWNGHCPKLYELFIRIVNEKF